MRLLGLLGNPADFFEEVRREDWKPSFRFYLEVTSFLSIVTPIVNYFGVESTDFSSSYQSQILAFRLLKNTLLAQYEVYAYFIEAFLIVGFSFIMLLLLTAFSHLVFRLMGGKGPILNAWKASCYGVGPCVLGGFLPYIALFAAFYSFLIQLYVGPKILYRVEESRAILYLAVMIALTFIEMFATGTTVGF